MKLPYGVWGMLPTLSLAWTANWVAHHSLGVSAILLVLAILSLLGQVASLRENW